MNEQAAPPTKPAKPKGPSFFSTPPGIVTGGLLLWVLSFAMSCALTIAIAKSSDKATQTSLIITAYVGYTVPILIAIGGTVMLIVGAVRWGVYGKHAVGAPGIRKQVNLLNSINERMLLSETAKRIAYRHEDIELLRSTIQNDIANNQFDAALVLVNEIGTTYGHKEEAEEYREQIILSRSNELENKVDRALSRLDDMLSRHDFDSAGTEAIKVQRLYGDSPRVRDVHRRVAHARDQYKHDLEREFLEASKLDDVDRAMDLLKIMDRYLTEHEAEPFRETARGVIGKKRENLGVQFKIAVHDKQWLRGVAVGEQLIREFPNSRMADEARGMLDLLRERAAGQRAASQQQRSTDQRPEDARTRATDEVPQA